MRLERELTGCSVNAIGFMEIKNPASHSAGRVKKVLLVKLHLSPLPAGHFQPGNADISNTLPRALRADGRHVTNLLNPKHHFDWRRLSAFPGDKSIGRASVPASRV
jgi:hypothetical protein